MWNLLGKVSKFGPNAQAIVQKVENAVKGALLKQSNLFESLNFRYFGPVDGHDVDHLVKVLKDLRDIPGPKILHTITKKGKGYAPAEAGSAMSMVPPMPISRPTAVRGAMRSARAPSRPSTGIQNDDDTLSSAA